MNVEKTVSSLRRQWMNLESRWLEARLLTAVSYTHLDYDGIPSKATAPGRHAWITFKTTNGKTFTTYVISPAEKLKKPRVATGYNSAKFWIDSVSYTHLREKRNQTW